MSPAGFPARRLLGFALGVLLVWLGMVAPLGAAFAWIAIALGLAASVASLLHAARAFEEPAPDRTVPLTRLARPLGLVGLGLLASWLALRWATAGSLGGHAAWLVPSTFLGLLVAIGKVAEALGPDDAARPFFRRHGFWLAALIIVLYLPTLGSHTLVDPWETHYGEVSREILAREDWISTWWANDGWFFSKPILLFWLQAGSMSLFGVDHTSGHVLEPVPGGPFAEPEWALRFPIFVCALLATYALYRAIASGFGRRAGLFSGIVLTTMPQWSLVSHQSMTDLPFVAAMTVSVAFIALGLTAKEDAPAPVLAFTIGSRSVSLSLRHGLVGTILALVLPQLVYLLSRNIALATGPDGSLRMPVLSVAGDAVSSGSPGNCGVWPGIAACEPLTLAYPRVQPVLLAGIFAIALVVLLILTLRERRHRELLFLAATLAASVSTLAKGPAGLVFPVVVVLAAAFVGRRWRLFLELGLPRAALALAVVVLPWFAVMFARHGAPFIDRLLFHDMWKRAFDHVHDTNQETDVSFRYYLWQLGYACFPWLGVLPSALARVTLGAPERRVRAVLEQVLLVWAVASFALFSVMQTKFHHYILPTLPPLAAIVGVGVARLAARPRLDVASALWLGLGLVLLGLVARDVTNTDVPPSDARFFHLFSYDYRRAWPSGLAFRGTLLALTATLASVTLAFFVRRARRHAPLIVSAGALVFTGFLLFTYLPRASRHYGQRDLIVRYLEERRALKGPLVAYQMNWKGENFYTGGELAIFVDSGKSFRDWMGERRKRGERTVYVLVPTPRLRGLRAELRNAKELQVLTDASFHDKFSLVRVRY